MNKIKTEDSIHTTHNILKAMGGIITIKLLIISFFLVRFFNTTDNLVDVVSKLNITVQVAAQQQREVYRRLDLHDISIKENSDNINSLKTSRQ